MILIPIIVLFWQENGLGLTEIFILQTVFSCIILLMEIPSGYLSDRYGRKPTLALGSALFFLAILTYTVSHSFIGFLIAETLYGIGYSFKSGTADALTYDTMLELHSEKEYRRVTGNQFFFYFGSEAFAGLLGGALASFSLLHYGNLRLPVYATLIPFGATVLISLLLTEPKRHKTQEKRHLQAMWNIGKNTIIHNSPLRSVIAIGSLLSAISYALFWFIQPYQQLAGLPLALFGVVHALLVGCGAFAAKYVHTLERWFDDRLVLIGIATTIILSTLLLSVLPISVWCILFFLLNRIAWSFKSPLLKDMINRMTTSDIRATVLSIQSFGMRLIFILTAPLIGYAADLYSIQQAILGTGIVGGIALVILFLLMRNVWEEVE
jgi:MFS family permease